VYVSYVIYAHLFVYVVQFILVFCLPIEVSKGKNVDKFLSGEKWVVFVKCVELM
jgi:hypothetical protein